uniref:Glutamate receptor n=1 Tax=Leersia perrieri TaxID=77586 RepID=A0A0D9XDZ1_9ORYZ
MAGHTPNPLFLLIFLRLCLHLATSSAQPLTVSVGLIIDAGSPVGKIADTTIPMALDDFYTEFPQSPTRVRLHRRDSRGDVVAAASAALELMKGRDGVRAILGPQSSVESAFVADLATRAEIPVVSFSATSPSVSPGDGKRLFFARAAASDAAQAPAIAALARRFGWRRVVPVYQDDDYGSTFVPFLVDALAGGDGGGVEVPYRCALPESATREAVAAEMYRMESMQTRAFVLHARPALAARVLDAAAAAGMMGEGFAWVITDGLTSLLAAAIDAPSQGVIGLSPYIPTTTPRLRDIKRRWARRFTDEHHAGDGDMGSYAVWAYDAAWAIATAANKLTAGDLSPPGLVNGTNGGATDFAGLGKSSSGKKFLELITNTTFDGLGGKFQLVDGELVVEAFRVVNIMDDGKARSIGVWTKNGGLTRHLGDGDGGEIAPVIWPGESTVVPRGWVVPTSGRRLRVAVPGSVNPGYRSIVHLDVDPATNWTTAGGFVVEVFEAAVRLLPYALPVEYVKAESMPYDKLVQKVGDGTFDAAVADITITAARSVHVDFTLPFMASGIAMVAPLQDHRGKHTAWVFLKPLRYDLWLVSAAFFLFTGFAIWFVEHRENPEFRGPAWYQVGTILHFGFSTLVFAHRENPRSNLSRFAVVVWLFVVLILQSSYTASFTSMLTVPQLEPSIPDYTTLWRDTGIRVGILNNSFMRDAMMNRSGFPASRLVPYKAVQSFHEALLNGTIGAVVDETPYIRVFLESYCDRFAMTGQRNKTGGFGFAFPKGSPYVADLSRAILALTESEEMNLIERKWFGDGDGGCAATQGGGPFTSDSLSFGSFWGLFLITGATSLVCCVVHLAAFVAANRRNIRVIVSSSSLSRLSSWKGIFRRIVELYDGRDLTAHTFRIKDSGGGGSLVAGVSPSAVHNEVAGSPVSVSNHTYMSDWSLQTSSPMAGGEIELAGAGGQAGEEAAAVLAHDHDGSGENLGGRRQ